MELFFEGVYVVLGLVHQWISSWIPFRPQPAPREVRWDVVAMLFGVACGALYAWSIEEPLSGWLISQAFVQQWYAWVGDWPWVLVVAMNLWVSDFLVYWAHRWMHSKFLWHVHAWHHSSKHVWWLSGLRASPVHVVLVILPHTVGYLLFPLGTGGIMLFGVIIFRIVNQHWLHSNIAVPFSRWLEKVFVTPRVHFVHHSADIRFTNSNYGFVFTFWDRAFGTFVDPDTVPLDEELGLDYENSYLRLMFGLPPPRAVPVSARVVKVE